MNDKQERVCTDCFLKHRDTFRNNNGHIDGMQCVKAY
jgi:hypothetical protein